MVEEKKEEKNSVVLKLEVEIAKKVEKVDGKRKVVNEMDPKNKGEFAYVRHDLYGLQSLLARYDTRKHPAKGWKNWTNVKQKLYKAYLNDKLSVTLSIPEAAWLTDYLQTFKDNEGKEIPLQESEITTMFGVIEALE